MPARGPGLLFGTQHHLRTGTSAAAAFVLEDGHRYRTVYRTTQPCKATAKDPEWSPSSAIASSRATGYRRRSLKTGSVSGLPTKNSSAIAPTTRPHPIHHPDWWRIPRMSIASAHTGITSEIARRINSEIARSAAAPPCSDSVLFSIDGIVRNIYPVRFSVSMLLESIERRRAHFAEAIPTLDKPQPVLQRTRRTLKIARIREHQRARLDRSHDLMRAEQHRRLASQVERKLLVCRDDVDRRAPTYAIDFRRRVLDGPLARHFGPDRGGKYQHAEQAQRAASYRSPHRPPPPQSGNNQRRAFNHPERDCNQDQAQRADVIFHEE